MFSSGSSGDAVVISHQAGLGGAGAPEGLFALSSV